MFLNSLPIFVLFFAVLPLSIIFSWKVIRVLLLIIPLIAFIQIFNMELDSSLIVDFMGFNLELVRFDKLTRIFGLIFVWQLFLAIYMRGMWEIKFNKLLQLFILDLLLGQSLLEILSHFSFFGKERP